MEERLLNDIISDIERGVYGETHSLLVWQDNTLHMESYFQPFDSDSLHYQYSVTKSITSVLVGIAIDQGFIESTDQKLLHFFPEYENIQNLDERKQAITLHDVLAMRTGLVWDEWTFPYGDPRNDTYDLFGSSDMIKHILDLPMSSDPGVAFTYNSGVTMLLSGIIENTTGRSTEQFAEEFLFNPLNIEKWQWDRGLNDDLTNTGWGLHLLPRDMLKVGTLFINNDERIVSNEWLDTSTKNYGNNYGYQWTHFGPENSISARGWGGQFIFIVRDKKLVIVTTAGNFTNNFGAGHNIAERIVSSL